MNFDAGKYLLGGVILVVASSVAAFILNFQGVKCLTELNASPFEISPTDEDLEAACFAITNSYVYSLYGVAIGSILIVVWYVKRKKSLSR